MLKNDYILRAIEQFMQGLARVLKLREEGKEAEATTELDTLSRDLTGLDVESLLLTNVETLQTLVGDAQRLALVARLFKELGELAGSRDCQRARNAYMKAFCLYDELEQQGASLDAHRKARDELMERLQ